MIKKSKNKPMPAGFTIVELLVVIVIISVLAAISFVSYMGINQRAIEASLQADLKNASIQLEIYRTINERYPSIVTDAGIITDSGNSFNYVYDSASDSYTLTATNSGVTYFTDSATRVVSIYTQPTNTFLGLYGGANDDYFNSVSTTSDDGYILAGKTQSYNSTSNYGFLVKADEIGAIDWAKAIGGGSDYDFRAIQTADGGYMAAGKTKSYGAGDWDVLLVKVASDGTTEWKETFGSTIAESIYKIIQTSDNGYLIIGEQRNMAQLYSSVFIAKLTSTGSVSWKNTWYLNSYNYVSAIQELSDGNIIVSGRAGNLDGLLVKISSTGTLIWNKKVSISSSADDFRGVVIDSDGNYVVTGLITNGGIGGYDAVLAKFAPDGSLTWGKVVGGTGDDVGWGITLANDGGYVLTGYTTSYGSGGNDSFISKYDNNGNHLWTNVVGGSGADVGNSVSQTSDGGYVMVGQVGGLGLGGLDAMVAKFDVSGNILNCSASTCQSQAFSVASPTFTVTIPSATYAVMNSSVVSQPAAAVNTFTINLSMLVE